MLCAYKKARKVVDIVPLDKSVENSHFYRTFRFFVL